MSELWFMIRNGVVFMLAFVAFVAVSVGLGMALAWWSGFLVDRL